MMLLVTNTIVFIQFTSAIINGEDRRDLDCTDSVGGITYYIASILPTSRNPTVFDPGEERAVSVMDSGAGISLDT